MDKVIYIFPTDECHALLTQFSKSLSKQGIKIKQTLVEFDLTSTMSQAWSSLKVLVWATAWAHTLFSGLNWMKDAQKKKKILNEALAEHYYASIGIHFKLILMCFVCTDN